MGRVARGNRSVHLTGDAFPESLMDISVSQVADIYEEKLRFWDYGHDHTGGRNGAVINADTADNLIYNGNFEYSINPSGAPDFWNVSGNIVVRQQVGGYWGNNECLISGFINAPNGKYCLYQDIPPLSGRILAPSPSGNDFSGQSFSFNCYASGVGSLYLGIYDGMDNWSTANTLTSNWTNYNYSHICRSTIEQLRIAICVNGYAHVDGVQGVIGTHSPSGYMRKTDADTVAWNGVAHVFNNVDPAPSGIRARDVVVLTDKYGGIRHPTYWGQRALGIALSPSVSGYQMPVLLHGIETINVYGVASYNDELYAGYQPDCSGYAVSEQYIDSYPTWGYTATMYPLGYSLGVKTTTGKGTLLAYISPVSQLLINGIAYGVAFPWNFKMVDSVDYATPEVGLTVVCTISKDGALFVGMTGAPVVSEVGYGWYRVIVPASDMAADSIILRATAVGAAQTDRSIYTAR